MPPIETGSTAIPGAVQAQLDQLIRWLSEIYSSELLGIYLHGSLAMGCFNFQRSDLDFLAITAHPPSCTQYDATAAAILMTSQQPIPIEISLCHYAQLHPWQYPPPFDFHFSEVWRTRMEAHLAGAASFSPLGWVDPDLAAHCTITRQRGVCVYGAPIADVIPEPPWADYLDAIDGDLRDILAAPMRDLVYALLNACRVWAAHAGRHILSKAEGAKWAQDRLTSDHRPIVMAALAAYAGECSAAQFPAEQVLTCLRWIREQL